jgi:hypothetical protein
MRSTFKRDEGFSSKEDALCDLRELCERYKEIFSGSLTKPPLRMVVIDY